MTVLAIDQGTSASKALVIAPGGEILGEGSAAVRPVAADGGAVTQDPEALLDSILHAGRTALRAAGDPQIEAIGLGNQGETVLAWDRVSGRPLGPAISWQDRRAAALTRGLTAHAEELMSLTGLPLDPYFAAPKLAWLRRQPGGADGVVTTLDAWVTHRLTGAFVTDVATASRTMLLDLDRAEWSETAGELFGLSVADQPRIVTNAEAVGSTTAFGPELPVTALIVDQQAALFAQACWDAGNAKCTYGTGAFLLANAGARAPRSSAGLSACVAWRLPGRATQYCLDGQIYTVGAAIRWCQELGLLSGPEELDAGHARPPEALPVFVPALAGLGAPYWAPEARGGWLGLGLASTRADLIDAVLWGIAAQVTHLATVIARDLGQPLSALRVDGGLTRSSRLMQAQADLLGAPVEVFASPDATAIGIGALAAVGSAGAGAELAEPDGTHRPLAVYEPRLSADRAAAYLARHAAASQAAIVTSTPADAPVHA